MRARRTTDKYATYVHIYVNNVTIAIFIYTSIYGILYGIEITRNVMLLFRTVHNFKWKVGFNG